jgi:hypothetical protein
LVETFGGWVGTSATKVFLSGLNATDSTALVAPTQVAQGTVTLPCGPHRRDLTGLFSAPTMLLSERFRHYVTELSPVPRSLA